MSIAKSGVVASLSARYVNTFASCFHGRVAYHHRPHSPSQMLTLQLECMTRCSVIAAANPAGGHYHRGKTVSENLKMSGALFSRFDLVFIMLDRPDENHDQRLSRHIVNMHAQRNGATFAASGPSQASPEMSLSGKSSADRSERTLSQRLRLVVSDLVKDPIPHEILRKYIAYARKYIHPRLTPAAAAVLKELYLKMREEARLGKSTFVS